MSTDVSEVHAALMMEVAHTSETLVDIQLRSRQYIPEDSELLFVICLKLRIYTVLIFNAIFVETEKHKFQNTVVAVVFSLTY
jgi:hypothetical protein